MNKEKPYYLHYQPAETNTSIREGWFFNEDSRQKVRSADDVFDMYERSVGGNSYFMLNIPPNREGKFPDRDADVLREVGKRINETYGTNLFKDAQGPKQVLDKSEKTFLVLDKQPQELIIATSKPVTFNRLMIREPVAVRGERVAKHAVDAYIDGNWQEIARATNIGNRRILRFPDVSTDRIRIRLLDSRSIPAISSVSAYYYQSRPPMLDSKRNVDGRVSIEPKNKGFNWNRTGENSEKNLNAGYRVFYTTDGTEPTASSKAYKEPFFMENAELKAIAVLNGENGPVYSERFGWLKQGWKITAVSSETQRQKAIAAFDENPNSYWMTEEGNNHFISLDLGKEITLNGFAYTPQTQHHRGMIEKGLFKISDDGEIWKEVEKFEFGNLINDPTKRFHYFKNKVKARYIRIEVLQIAADEKFASMAELDVF